jgi:chemotaxis signal transduction protein
MEAINNKCEDNYPYVLFKLNNEVYAVSCCNVKSIMKAPALQLLPNMPAGLLGIFVLLGNTVNCYDLRNIFGFKSLDSELKEFEEMLSKRKQDHVNWVNALQSSVDTGEAFSLATDPHKCAFGRWYDNFESPSGTVMMHLRKIKEPHDKLHRAAHLIEDCRKMQSKQERDACMRKIMDEIRNLYMPQVLDFIDATVSAYLESIQPMALVIGEPCPIAFLVDEVLSVEQLFDLNDKGNDIGDRQKQNYISAVKTRKNDTDIVLQLDEELLLSSLRKLADCF